MVCLTVQFQGHPLRAELSPADPVHLFATCAGRLSALMEHQWLMQDAGSAQTESWRDAMLSLLEAATPVADRGEALNWRITGKVAHARLLSAVTFTNDPEIAAWALRRSDMLIADCMSMVLS